MGEAGLGVKPALFDPVAKHVAGKNVRLLSARRVVRADGKVVITPAQLGMLLEGIDWRMPRRTWRPEIAG